MFHNGIVVALHNSKDVKLQPPPPPFRFQPLPGARFRTSHALSQSKLTFVVVGYLASRLVFVSDAFFSGILSN